MVRRLAVVAVALAVIAAACGDDGGTNLDEGEQAVADSLAVAIGSESGAGDPFESQADAQCFAEGIVAELGTGRLVEVGLTADAADSQGAFAALTTAEIESVADVALECIDVEAFLSAEFAAGGISEESASCLADAVIDTDFMRRGLIAGMTGDETYDPSSDPDTIGALMSAATECLTPEELSLIMGG
jgi:hypothetical protein